jgi:hypothetical protein
LSTVANVTHTHQIDWIFLIVRIEISFWHCKKNSYRLHTARFWQGEFVLAQLALSFVSIAHHVSKSDANKDASREQIRQE